MSQYNQPPGPPRHGPPPPPGSGMGGPYPPPPSVGRPMYPGPMPYGPPPQQTVHIVAKSGGFKSAVMWVFAMLLFVGVFIFGITVGAGAMLAGSSFEPMVMRENYRDGLFARNTIAVIPIEGVINGYTAEFARAAVDEVLDDSSVRAVVLRVDSPGGEVAASDEIWYQVERLKKSGLTVVASYGGVAASGGYYVSCGADHIVAEPTCITGSIGVIAQVMTMEQLMNKVGIEPVTLVASSSPDKDVANNIFRSWTDEDRTKLRKMLDSAYATFRQRVAAGRADVLTDEARLDDVADGSIYTADEALEKGLVDGVGYLDDAIAQAETMVGMKKDSAGVFIVREPPSLFGNGILGQVQEHAHSRSAATGDLLDAERVRALLHDLASPRVAYLMH